MPRLLLVVVLLAGCQHSSALELLPHVQSVETKNKGGGHAIIHVLNRHFVTRTAFAADLGLETDDAEIRSNGLVADSLFHKNDGMMVIPKYVVFVFLLATTFAEGRP